MSVRIQRLRAEVDSDREALERHLETLTGLELDDDPGPGTLARAAWSLHHAYTSVETILERIARTVEGELPTGPDWHKTLLDDAALDIEATRPALLTRSTVAALHDLRAFRQFVRHGYAVELDAERLADLQRRAARLHPTLVRELEELDDWLADVAAALE